MVFLDPTSRKALNPLNCEIPESIGNLRNLTELYLSNDVFRSYLHGELPATIQNLKKLQCFYVSHGDLSGSIPSWLNTMPLLQGIFMRHNSFSGQIPDLSELKYVEDMWLDTQSPGSGLSGNITWISNWQYLRSLHIQANSLSGSLPKSLCSIECSAYYNHWSCPLPAYNCCGVLKCGNDLQIDEIVDSKVSELRQASQTRLSGSPLPYACTVHQ